ncbi:hypothetical protein TRFO_31067 [Tritrichomonas foetus]|uniref:Uncharacterized protein n=1 Tax=Tritrichomonas foetus TaxID=1144522 RepID=A0A1J4JSA6_9EUKA|nr:hypothetical protein TRFO_31067 [Tritrichomonas foetus]|eukprot:OHT01985.1 hypothetical protein TRFO_31067 [Tritrichomonas foetus]
MLDKLSLQREKAYHEGHNKYLRNILKKYINGTAISKDLIDKPNTLFIVNQITNAPFKNYDQDDIPIIDADLTLAANRLQGYK